MKDFSDFIKEMGSATEEEYNKLFSHSFPEGEEVPLTEAIIHISILITFDTLERYHNWLKKPD
jgi:hypothetical protein